jgi:GNAT superfamily N-acetyltransferase
MPTLGAQVVPAKLLELRRLLQDLDAADLGVLDESLGEWMNRPLGREALATVVLPAAGSTYVCLLNFESAGLIVLERGKVAARIRALAVAPDLRRRGVARTLLEATNDFAREAGLRWLWMPVPSSNTPATSCGLACDFRRYRPQFLRREHPGILSLKPGRAHAERLEGDEAQAQLMTWTRAAAEQGDAWCSEVAKADLFSWSRPNEGEGKVYLLVSNTDEVGVAHVVGEALHPRVTLWLDRALWNTPRETNVLKSVLDTLAEAPPAIDLEFGSGGHLRTSVTAYKSLGFRPIVRREVVMVRKVKG